MAQGTPKTNNSGGGQQKNNQQAPKTDGQKAAEQAEKARAAAEKALLERVYECMSEICRRMGGRATNTILLWRRTRNFPCYRIGGRWYAEEKDIRAWEEHCKSGKDVDEFKFDADKKKTAMLKKLK